MNTKRRTTTRRRAAFTLPELLLAITIASMIGFAVVLILSAIGTATAEQSDNRLVSVRRQVAIARLGALARESIMALDTAPDAIVLWKADTNGNGLPDLSEIRLIGWDSGTGIVTASEAPLALAPADDFTLAFTDDFISITAAIEGSALLPGATVLKEIATWEIDLDNADPQFARQLRIALTITNEHSDDPASVYASLRAAL